MARKKGSAANWPAAMSDASRSISRPSSTATNPSGEALYSRTVTGPGGLETADGGPTTWQAAILSPDAPPYGSTVGSEDIEDHREFYFEMSDFQHAYNNGTFVGADTNGIPVLTQIVQPNPFDATVAFDTAVLESFTHTFSHFHLNIEPVRVYLARTPHTVSEEGARRWYHALDNEPIGLSSAAVKLLETIQ